MLGLEKGSVRLGKKRRRYLVPHCMLCLTVLLLLLLLFF